MQGYKLNLTFYSPCVFHHPPMLDAILSYCLQRESHRYIGYYAGTWRDREYDGINRLPEVLEFYSEIPLATRLQYDADAPLYADSWKKRFEPKYQHLADFGKAKRRIDTTSGQYRSFNMPLPARVIRAGWFYFIGDGHRAIELLNRWIWAIGKKPSEGFGVIENLDLQPCDLNEIEVLKRRPVPVEIAAKLGIQGMEQYCAWRPPYWGRRNHARCVVPA